MEEFVGGLWHRFITRTASRSHPQAAVRLEDIERTAGVLFRAMGGDPACASRPQPRSSTAGGGAGWHAWRTSTTARHRPRSMTRPCVCRPRSPSFPIHRTTATFTCG